MSRASRLATRLLLLSAALLATSGPTLAQIARDSHPLHGVVTVRFNDLNIESSAGARVLYDRIRAAARKVCGQSVAPWYPGSRARWVACYTPTLDVTVRQVGVPLVTALHERLTHLATR